MSYVRFQVTVRIIGQIFKMDLGYNPLYRAPERYLNHIELIFVGFRCADLIPVPEIAMQVVVP